MNDWPSEIVESFSNDCEDVQEDIKRMARVLRELVAYLRDICKLKNISLPDASDDAKELLK